MTIGFVFCTQTNFVMGELPPTKTSIYRIVQLQIAPVWTDQDQRWIFTMINHGSEWREGYNLRGVVLGRKHHRSLFSSQHGHY
ncbi:uncharacterized protein LOC118435331 isoform X2 [Folsomia candida]|uniref:uncharacterized protein LOC118435331 isoform X2 n=1 Tax=Folsomia candida TaxID=158441 RepID=UPI001604A53B|nr:uncharacterized protein LOC118435331 isoform X2 [Folsomia candida]